MKRQIFTILLALTFVFAVPAVSLAASDEEGPKIDARLEGYKDPAALKDAGGTALTWLLLLVLTGMCMGVLFMNSKRTHLD
jgi:hypothetical protein